MFRLTLIISSFLALSLNVCAQENAFQEAMRVQLVAKLKTIPKGSRIELQTHSGAIYGAYGGYHKYDDSVWLTQDGHLFADAFDVRDVQAVKLAVDIKGNI